MRVRSDSWSGGSPHIDKAMLREWRQDFAREMRKQGIAANATPRSVRGQTKGAAKDVFYRTQRRGHCYALREKLDGIVRATTPVTDPARAKLLETRRAAVEGRNAVASKLEDQGEIVLGGHVRYFAMHLPPVAIYRTKPSNSRALRDRVKSVANELYGTGAIRDPARPKLLATRRAIVDGWIGIAARLEAQGEIVLASDVRYFAMHLPAVLTDREKLAKKLMAHMKARQPEKEPRVQQHTRELERTR